MQPRGQCCWRYRHHKKAERGGRNTQDFFPSLESRVALIGRIDSEAEGQGILGNVVLYYIEVSRRKKRNKSKQQSSNTAFSLYTIVSIHSEVTDK